MAFSLNSDVTRIASLLATSDFCPIGRVQLPCRGLVGGDWYACVPKQLASVAVLKLSNKIMLFLSSIWVQRRALSCA